MKASAKVSKASKAAPAAAAAAADAGVAAEGVFDDEGLQEALPREWEAEPGEVEDATEAATAGEAEAEEWPPAEDADEAEPPEAPARGGKHAVPAGDAPASRRGAHQSPGDELFDDTNDEDDTDTGAAAGVWILTPGTGTPGSYSAAATAAEAAEARAKRLRRLKITLKALVAICVVLAIALIGFLSYERWWVHDDVADIQGVWLIRGEVAQGHDPATIQITDTKIILDKDTTYTYTLDTSRKVIHFAFQNLSGEGHYRFSADRRQLIIVDGEFSWLETCASDFWWLLRSQWAKLVGGSQPALGSAENAALLSLTIPVIEG